MTKMGADDFIVAYGYEAFAAAPNLTIEEAFSEEEIQKFNDQTNRQIERSATPFIGKHNCTDLGNAERLHLRESGNIKWSKDVGWRYWNGQRWIVDQTQSMITRAVACVRKIYIEAAQTKDSDQREKLGNWASKSEALARIHAMISLCEPMNAVLPEVYDQNIWLLNLRNGTLNLLTGEFREHNKEDLITKLIDIDYDPNAQCPLWHKFLERIIENPEDRQFLQKAVGYSLTGATKEQCLFILYGLGANGKSTFISTIDSMMADYASQTNSETLMVKSHGGAIPNDVAALSGARFVCAVETEGGKRLAESLVKRMTGGDKITARFLNHEFFTFTPTFKIWLAVNHQPRIHGTDEAIWRRIRLIPFVVTIPRDERDEDLAQKLLAELPGILSWAIDGCKLWLIQKLGITTSVDSATQTYRQESDAINSFLEECCTLGKDLYVSKTDLYNKYAEWGKQGNEYTLTKRNFGTRMLEKGFKDKKNVQWFWLGITLNSTPNSSLFDS